MYTSTRELIFKNVFQKWPLLYSPDHEQHACSGYHTFCIGDSFHFIGWLMNGYEKRPIKYLKRDLSNTSKETYWIIDKSPIKYVKIDLSNTSKEPCRILQKRPSPSIRSKETCIHEERPMDYVQIDLYMPKDPKQIWQKKTCEYEKRPIIETGWCFIRQKRPVYMKRGLSSMTKAVWTHEKRPIK